MNKAVHMLPAPIDFDINLDKSQPLITVFTPTFNRADKIHRVFESLMAQDCDHGLFEWVVVDDGSADDTRARFQDFAARADFALSYRYQSNRGKHIAMNRGVRMARGELFVVCDSADAFDAGALGYFLARWDEFDERMKKRLYGINVRSRDQNGHTRTPPMPRSPMISNNAEAVIVHKQVGDAWGIARTEVMQEFPFPESHVGSHYPEIIVWNRMGRKYDALYTNEVLHTTFYDTTNSITRNELARDRVKLAHKILRESAANLTGDLHLFWRAPVFFIKRALVYNFCVKMIPQEQLTADQKLGVLGQLWCLFFRPFGPFATRRIERRLAELNS